MRTLAVAVALAVVCGRAAAAWAETLDGMIAPLPPPFQGRTLLLDNDPDRYRLHGLVEFYGEAAQRSAAAGLMADLGYDLGKRGRLFGTLVAPLTHDPHARPWQGDLGATVFFASGTDSGTVLLKREDFVRTYTLVVPETVRVLWGVRGGVTVQRAADRTQVADQTFDVATTVAMAFVGLHKVRKQYLVIDVDSWDRNISGRRSGKWATAYYGDVIARLAVRREGGPAGAAFEREHRWGWRVGASTTDEAGFGGAVELGYYPQPGRGLSLLFALGFGFGA